MYGFFRWLAIVTGWPLQLLFFKRKTYYEDKTSSNRFVKGGALIISNHYSVFDYMVNLFLFPGRKLFVVMAEMIFKRGKFFHWAMRCFGGIRSDRDIKGMRFIDESVKVLERGKLVQIYPEAHTTDDGNMLDFKPSYIMIALRAGVPIIPVMTDGNYGFFKRVHIIIGKKIYLTDYCTSLNPTREEIVALNEMVYAKAVELREELERRKKAKKR
ncbi:MAG: 1-acyl-sn-glycerol-3-phosphate acyltransferase [Clostridia bacterium]|nr:1-acyl-sn-glycerol-3-phosphate acyltransferase [Clostridia bacterium]